MKKIFTLVLFLSLFGFRSLADSYTQTVQVAVNDWSTWDAIGSFNSDVVYEDGVYTVKNFLNTGCQFSFKLPEPTEQEAYTTLELILDNNIDSDDAPFMYLINPADGSYPDIYLTYNGALATFSYPCFYYSGTYCQAYYYTPEKEYQWYIQFCMDGQENRTEQWIYFGATFMMKDGPQAIANGLGTSAITTITSDEATPEYYNLQGMKVSNPSQGLYIKKTGDKISKVILK